MWLPKMAYGIPQTQATCSTASVSVSHVSWMLGQLERVWMVNKPPKRKAHAKGLRQIKGVEDIKMPLIKARDELDCLPHERREVTSPSASSNKINNMSTAAGNVSHVLGRRHTAPAKQQVLNGEHTKAQQLPAKEARKIKRLVSHYYPSTIVEAGNADDVLSANREHLCILVHGLGGGPWDWTPMVMEFEKILPDNTQLVVHVSRANSFLKTFDGIDVCGERLADEIKDIVKSEPQLKYISVIGHSLGGLIGRYAIGSLFCTETNTMFGLRPRHFVTIVSPHLGCDSSNSTENTVPFLRWMTGIPLLGFGIKHVTSLAAAPGAKFLYRRTGSQLFLQDRDDHQGGLPIVFQMAVNGLSEEVIDSLMGEERDSTPRKRLLPFGQALASFESRTAYSNVQGDHMVSWPNASIRKISQLPEEACNTERNGIVMESDSSIEEKTIKLTKDFRAQDIMIESLQKVSWKRVDVKLKMSPYVMPHNYIQARPADNDSLTVARHLMQVLAN